MLSGSIRENLRLGLLPNLNGKKDEWNGKQGNEKEEEMQTVMEDVCREVGLHDWVSGLPEGYGTDVGGRGARLSGGQRQKVAVARALLRLKVLSLCEKGKQEKRILLLDEATSALDRESERCVVGAIEKFCRDEEITVLHVSHQEEVVRRAGKVVVLVQGRIVDQENLDQVVGRKGKFWELEKRESGGV